ncbi:hypothetical protein [Aquimarina agarilytica]|uniref:hypothetical protein n=1 Tax=Aquimarina agarilytica TaxID=1087449 RepID=UPI000287FC95|nr:hypothetical protein [Aquimarina agarilytica]
MGKYILILTFLMAFFSTDVFCQKQILKLTSHNAVREIIFEEGDRVRVKSSSGKKFVGRILFIDNTSISLKGKVIEIKDIEKIKKNPLLVTVPSSIISFSAIGAGFLFGANSLDSDILPYVGLLSAGSMFAFYAPLNPLKGYKSVDYKIKITNE